MSEFFTYVVHNHVIIYVSVSLCVLVVPLRQAGKQQFITEMVAEAVFSTGAYYLMMQDNKLQRYL